MGSKYNEDIEKRLVKVMVHEFSKCFNFFWQFANYSAEYIVEVDDRSKSLNVSTYNSYSLFVHYLYEFTIACYKKDNKLTSNVDYKITDMWINNEIDKILRKYVYLIDNNIAPDSVNDRSYYDVECPKNFGRDFRSVRNNIAHTDYRRIYPNERISLSEFYVKYHQFVMLLFHEVKTYWLNEDYENLDLGEITEFHKLIHSKIDS